MRHAGPYGSMVAGIVALVFATGATYGALRVVLGGGASAAAAIAFGAAVGLWVGAYFSGGGRSVRRALRGWVVAVAVAAAVAAAAGAAGRLEVGWLAPSWIVAWLVGACVALGSNIPVALGFRIAVTVVLGLPVAVGAVAIARIPVLGFVVGVAGLAAPLAVADAFAGRRMA